jgi:hypothetical protein
VKFEEIKYTHQEKQAFKEDFAKRKKRQWMVAGVALLIASPFLYMKVTKRLIELPIPLSLAGPIFAGIAFSGLAFSFWNWRCPACHRYLGRSLGPAYCPKCGIEFEENR